MIVEQSKVLYRLFLHVSAVFLPLSLAAPTNALAASAAGPPLPDVPTLIAQVREHQRQMDSVREDYTFRELDVTQELNKNGSVKKTETEEADIFYVNSHEVRRVIQRDGQPLSADEEKKEQQNVMKEIQRAQSTPPGQFPPGRIVISVGRILAMAKFSSPRREMLDGRSMIAFDFQGDPHAKAHNLAEDAARRTTGTVWIDEKDRQVRRLTAQLTDNVHAGFGLVSLGKGSSLIFEQKLVNNELWLPTGAQIHLVAHAIAVFGFRANIRITDDDYRKFHAVAMQQAGETVAPPGTP